jgi:hypothetical protein
MGYKQNGLKSQRGRPQTNTGEDVSRKAAASQRRIKEFLLHDFRLNWFCLHLNET